MDLDVPMIGAFLEHLETERHNNVATRNARLAAIHSSSATRCPARPSTPHSSNACWLLRLKGATARSSAT